MPKLRWTLASFTAAAALAAVSSPAQAQSCGDPWVTKAVREVYGRAPSSTDCKIDRYGGGRWGGYDQLKKYVELASVCDDPWIAQAYNDLYGRSADGRGTSGECNVFLYGGAKWSTFADLKSKITTANSALTKSAAKFDKSGGLTVAGKTSSAASLVFLTSDGKYSSGTGQTLSKAEAEKKAPQLKDAANIAAAKAAGIVAAGGGNIVAAGGGNIVAAGGGN